MNFVVQGMTVVFNSTFMCIFSGFFSKTHSPCCESLYRNGNYPSFFATGNVVTFIYKCWKVFLENVFDFYLQLLESVNPNP